MAEFQIVERLSNWGYWDQIGGKTIKPGKYMIKWPDGNVSTEIVVIDRRPFSYGDMGQTYESEDCKAYAAIEYHGSVGRVYLQGLAIKKVNE